MTTWQQQLDGAIDRQFDDMVALRRHLHSHPEVSGEEYATSALLKERLDSLGLQVRLGSDDRGVIADLFDVNRFDADRIEGESIFAIRGDIDALRIQDEKDVAYSSQAAGVMHACGHDAHTAITFGVISALADLQSQGGLDPRFHVRAIFQPAEETCEGALQMIDDGALRGVGALVATHVDPKLPVGSIAVRTGVMTADCLHLRIEIKGRGGHAARPHTTRDPIAAAAQLIQSLYAHVPRAIDSQSPVVLSFGQILGGHNGNVIPDVVTLNGTLRTLDVAVRKQVTEDVDRIAQAIAAATKTEIAIEFVGAAPSVTNCPELTRLIAKTVVELSDDVGVEQLSRPSMGGEDFAFYGAHVPATMFRVGIVSDTCGGGGLHTPGFDLDEQALKIATRVIAHTAIRWCESHAKVDLNAARKINL